MNKIEISIKRQETLKKTPKSNSGPEKYNK